MINLGKNVVINRSKDVVLNYVSNYENEPYWVIEVRETKKTSEGPIGLGTRFSDEVRFLGQRLLITYEITEYEPDKMVVIKTISGPILFEAAEIFEDVNGGTRFNAVVRAYPSGFLKLIEPLTSYRIKKQWDSNLANLKGCTGSTGPGSI